jgi:hypothetical protein
MLELTRFTRSAILKAKNSKAGHKEKAVRTRSHNVLHASLEDSFKAAHQVIIKEIKAIQLNKDDIFEEKRTTSDLSAFVMAINRRRS